MWGRGWLGGLGEGVGVVRWGECWGYVGGEGALWSETHIDPP